jgi:hypothetical protein
LFRVTPETADIFHRPFLSRWIFDVEVLARLAQSTNAAAAIYEYPLERWQDVQGSRLKPADFFAAAIDLAAIYWRSRGGKTASQSSIQHPASNIQHRDAA